ncbi:MAG TPA: serine protease [Planctomycetota bacterium]
MRRLLACAVVLLLSAAGFGSESPVLINDSEISAKILKTAESLVADGKVVKVKDLIAQLSRREQQCIELTPASDEKLTSTQVYSRARQSVLVVAGLYKCDKCTHWHVSTASGFVISSSGIAVTNYHVINSPKNETLVALTPDGKVLQVKEVLAASAADDLAVIQLDGQGLRPLPLKVDAPVGSKISLVSHPDGHFYTLSEGIISRYCVYKHNKQDAPCMVITAEFAKGSSGAPIIDECGNAVGLVASTHCIYYDTADANAPKNLQMVLRQCIPTSSLLRLVKSKE